MKKTAIIPICIAPLLLTVFLAGIGSRKGDAATAYEPIIQQYPTAPRDYVQLQLTPITSAKLTQD